METNFLAQKPDIILINGSTGAFSALKDFLGTLKHLPVPIVVAIHIPTNANETLMQIWGDHDTSIPLAQADQRITDGVVFAPPGQHISIGRDADHVARIRLSVPTEGALAPSIDRLLLSAADVFQYPVAVMLSGFGSDGQQAVDVFAQKQLPVLIQDPKSAMEPDIPINAGLVSPQSPQLTVREIAKVLHQACS
ncbi:MAG: hypothetical protein CMH56_01790 [Myxococcales bacterium]|nr:hypothetical protein [Myxococcales bacterium]|tara:strand:- start:1234 stop:1815 length:582 start_codon:yes stop_codon:yes gene_type:complete